MSDFDANEDDMRFFSRPSDPDLDRLLAGQTPPEDGDLDELAIFVSSVRALQEAPDEMTEAVHLAAIAGAAASARTEIAHSSEEQAPPPARSKPMLKNPFASLGAKIALAAVLTLTLFSGAAYADALPRGVQGTVSDVAGNVGLSVPGGNDDGDVNNVDDGAVNNVDQGDQTNTDDGQQGNTDDGAQDNADDDAQNDRDDAAQNNLDDGAQNNLDDGAQNDRDDGAQNDRDEAQNDRDDGAQDNADDGNQGNEDQGSQGNVENGNGGEGNN